MIQELLIAIIGVLSVLLLCLLALLARERDRSADEREAWTTERAEMLNRIMAVDYTRFCLSIPNLKTQDFDSPEPYEPLEDETIAGTVRHIAAEQNRQGS